MKPSRKVRTWFVNLAELEYTTCQACGESPAPAYCFFDDDLTDVYQKLEQCDCLLFGSPIHFDTVSSSAKLFIDRCNCIRPADFDNVDPAHDFLKRWHKKRPGGMVLVGGAEGWFEGARRTIAGFFKWTAITNEGLITCRTRDFREAGTAANDPAVLAEADALGRRLAELVEADRD